MTIMIYEEFKNEEQQINHKISWEETHCSRENKNIGGISIGTAIHFLIVF